MSTNVYVICIDCIIALNALEILMASVDSVNIYSIYCNVNMKIKACNALNAMFVETVDTLLFVALTQHLYRVL